MIFGRVNVNLSMCFLCVISAWCVTITKIYLNGRCRCLGYALGKPAHYALTYTTPTDPRQVRQRMALWCRRFELLVY